MSSILELYDSRVSYIALEYEIAIVHFSHAYIRKSKNKTGKISGSGWSQEAELKLLNPTIPSPLPTLPNTIADGYLEVGGIKHELIPLPFRRKVGAKLHLEFVDSTEIEIIDEKPTIELIGKPIYLEDFS